jgi:hypothetical protein
MYDQLNYCVKRLLLVRANSAAKIIECVPRYLWIWKLDLRNAEN